MLFYLLSNLICLMFLEGSVLATFSLFTQTAVLTCLVINLLLLSLLYIPLRKQNNISSGYLYHVLLFLIIAVVYYKPSQVVIGGQDPSVYASSAGVMANSAGVLPSGGAFDLLDKKEKEELLKLDFSKGNQIYYYNGIYLRPDGSYNFDFVRGPSILLAEAMLFLPANRAFFTNNLYSLLAIMTFFLFCCRFYDKRNAFFMALLLLFCPAELWFGRAPYSEVPGQFFLFLSFISIVELERNRQNKGLSFYWLITLFLASISAALIRTELTILPYLIIAICPIFIEKRKLLSLAVQWIFVLGLLMAENIDKTTGPIYFARMRQDLPFGSRVFEFALLFLLISLPLYFSFGQKILKVLVNLYNKVITTRLVFNVYFLAVIALLAYGFSYRLQIWGMSSFGNNISNFHNRGVNTMDEFIFQRLSVLVGFPILILSFWGCFSLLKKKFNLSYAFFIFFCFFAAYASKLFFQQANSPMLYWAVRRYLPIMIPFIIITGVEALIILSRNYLRQKFIPICCYFLSLCPMFYLDSILWKHGEMNGALKLVSDLDKHFISENKREIVLLTDRAYKHNMQPVKFIGGYDVIMLDDLKTLDLRLLRDTLGKLKKNGKKVYYFLRQGELPDKAICFESNYYRLDQPMFSFPDKIKFYDNTFCLSETLR